jgi:hypothetical protein
LGGIGFGLAYISPVASLMRWFPDNRGFATGLGLTAFGGGAAVAAPLIRNLTDTFAVPPERFAGDASELVTGEGGRQFVDMNGALQEVVVATAADIAQIGGLDAFGGKYIHDDLRPHRAVRVTYFRCACMTLNCI